MPIYILVLDVIRNFMWMGSKRTALGEETKPVFNVLKGEKRM
jgi:hypothetical protein